MKLAFIGLGVMGDPMAGHLAHYARLQNLGHGRLDTSSLIKLLADR